MKINNVVFTIDELNDAKARAARVSAQLVTTTTVWLDVAVEVADAKASLKQFTYEMFVLESGLTKAVADKLLKIAHCKPLYSTEVRERIGYVDGWTTLYEVAKLSDNRIDELIQSLDADPSLRLSRKVLKNFSLGNSVSDNPVIICAIETVESKLHSLTETQIRDLASKVADVQRLFNSSTEQVTFNQPKRSKELLEQKASASVAKAA